ncbi:MAG: hypothetical protein RLW68_10425 [Devosia marina]|uniref:hypothetical protein n=1 Tax=Devosia marina TaxID=2683198 RepID=UPI0032EBC7A2
MSKTRPKGRSMARKSDPALEGYDKRRPYGVRLSARELEIVKARANAENKLLGVYLRDQALQPSRLLDLQTWARLAKSADRIDALFERLEAQDFCELANEADELRQALARFRTALLVRKVP